MDREFKVVGKGIKKIDALALATGEVKFTADITLPDMLHIAFLYSPHPHAEIEEIDTEEALLTPGVELVLTYKDVPQTLHTTAGQGYPEPSPYDTRILDKRVRFVGDRVAIVAAKTKEIAVSAAKKIRVKYKLLPYNFDPEKAGEAEPIPPQDAYHLLPTIYEPRKNIAAGIKLEFGDVEAAFSESDIVVEDRFEVQYASHSAIEPHAAVAFYDERGRLNIISTTQVPFHARRIVSRVLGIPLKDIRVIKPRIGGGFGGKQEVFLEQVVALVTMITKKPSKVILSRREVFTSSRTRHPMITWYKAGVKRDTGEITALKLKALMNAGAYGPHALTVMANAGSKVLPLFNKIKNILFEGYTVYTNLPVGGAYRGYGATQGYFGYNVMLDMIAEALDIDVLEFFKKWHIKKGETSPIFEELGEGKEGVAQIIRSCALSECIEKGAERIGWYKKRRKKIRNGDKVRGVGAAILMQGSGIPKIDMGAAYIKMNEDGSFNLHIGATDIGTGSDTILAQIAAEEIGTRVDKIIVYSSDTDFTPFDVGAYASSTTYISGGAVLKCARKIKKEIVKVAAEMLNVPEDAVFIDNGVVYTKDRTQHVSFEDVALYSMYSRNQHQIQAVASHIGLESPPPFMAQFAEVEVDIKTGRIEVIKFVSAVDCGQPINPVLVEGQVEGATVNGIGYALWEDYIFDKQGRLMNASFWDYKIPSIKDVPEIETIICKSYEPTGPMGAKSVAEIGINGPIPAIANAVYDAIGIRLKSSPFTPEKVLKAIKEQGLKL